MNFSLLQTLIVRKILSLSLKNIRMKNQLTSIELCIGTFGCLKGEQHANQVINISSH